MTIEGLRLRARNSYIRATASCRKKSLNKYDFTIISNNCWGGVVYESYSLPKLSPTVGMYFSPQDYLKFVVDLKTYLNCRMEFVEPNDSKNRHLFSQDISFGNYPIAKLGDIEIAMLHFHTKDEAIAKWNRRVERVCWDNLIIKMNDQNGCSYEDAKFFLDTPMQCKVKIFFSAKKAWQKKDNRIIYIPQLNSNHVCASKEPFGKSKICNINDIINAL